MVAAVMKVVGRFTAGLILGVAGCGHAHLMPAPSAAVVPGAPGAAFSLASGVRCSADVAGWEGRPDDLPDTVTPVKVRLMNSSGKPLRVLYQEFALVGAEGRRYQPIPVLPLEPDASSPRLDPIYAASKFFVSARYHDVYQGFDAWPQPLERDDDFYTTQFRRWGDQRPSFSALRKALPEGVLDNGGVISGYLYFETPIRREGAVTFEAELDDDAGQGTIASLKIPFRIQ